jgi:hypothetical protein
MSIILANALIPADFLRFDNIDFFRRLPAARVTEHPIEFGTDVTDHVQVLSDTLVFRGRVTATPLTIPAPGARELAVGWFERNTGQLIKATTPRGIFTSVVVTRWDHGDEGVQALVFDVTMKEIRLALGVSVAIPPRLPNPAAEVGSSSPTDAGVQPPAPVPPPPPDTSFLGTLAAFL